MTEEKRRKLEWETDHIFFGEVAAIKVNRATGEHGQVLFSYELGKKGLEGRFQKFLAPSIRRGANFQPAFEWPNVLGEYSVLMQEVTAYVEVEVRRSWEKQLDERRLREEGQLEREKPKLKPGLKTLGRA